MPRNQYIRDVLFPGSSRDSAGTHTTADEDFLPSADHWDPVTERLIDLPVNQVFLQHLFSALSKRSNPVPGTPGANGQALQPRIRDRL